MIHSLSKLGTFESCAAKYKFQYIDRLPRGAPGPAAARGIDAHKAMEDYILGVVPALPSGMEMYGGFLDGLKRLEGIVPEAKLAFNSDWSKANWDDEGIWWRGVLDLLVPPQGGTAHVYDWKTGKIYDDHEDQRQIYAIATSIEYPDAFEITCSHVYLDLGKNVAVTYHRDQLVGFRERWRRRFTAVEGATEFPYNPQFGCRWCPYSKAVKGPCPF
jgi:hypothetical protein